MDAAVADVTLNANVLPVMGIELLVSLSVIWNDAVIPAGAVKKNVNVLPPLAVARVTAPAPDGPYVGTEKSVTKPVVAPLADITFTVHVTISLIRTTVVDPLVCPIQLSTDEIVGVPRTANENVLPVMAVPLLSFSVIKNTDVMTAGAVTTKLNVLPPLVVASDGTPLPDGPYDGTEKSPAIAIAAPAASETVTVQEITS